MELLIYFITIIHIIVILFVLLSPFSNSNYLLFMHFVIVPFIMFHWIMNDNTCCLTVAEKMIKEKVYNRQVDMNECITYKLIAPIYDFNNNHKNFEIFTYILTISLWLISGYKLYTKIEDHQITSFKDLMKL